MTRDQMFEALVAMRISGYCNNSLAAAAEVVAEENFLDQIYQGALSYLVYDAARKAYESIPAPGDYIVAWAFDAGDVSYSFAEVWAVVDILELARDGNTALLKRAAGYV